MELGLEPQLEQGSSWPGVAREKRLSPPGRPGLRSHGARSPGVREPPTKKKDARREQRWRAPLPTRGSLEWGSIRREKREGLHDRINKACCGAVPAKLIILNTRGAVPAEHTSPRGAHCHLPENGAAEDDLQEDELASTGGLPLRQ